MSFTSLGSALWKGLVLLQPLIVSQIVDRSCFSNDQVQVSVPSPVERVPSSVTAWPTRTPVGAVQMALAGWSTGAVAVLTVNERVAGEASVLPAASMARTLNVWVPLA